MPLACEAACSAERRQAWPTDKLETVLLFLPPALLLFTLFVILPMGEAVCYSFFNWNGFGTPEDFVGLENYRFCSRTARSAWRFATTFLIIVVSLAVQLPLALALAILLAERIPRRRTFRMIFFLPYVLAEIAAGPDLRFVYDGDYGLLATIGACSAPRRRICWPTATSMLRDPDRHSLEVFRLPHDALHRGRCRASTATSYEAARIDGATRPQICATS